MDRDIKWAETALKDLDSIANYIAKDSRYYAAAFVKEVREASYSLAYFAERGRIVPEFNNSAIREIFVKRYRIVYKIEESIVYIIAIIHGARDLLTLWEKEGRTDLDGVV